MSVRVILDCDNTAGIPGYEIDDALALLYLASHPNVELLGVTTTFGNGTIDQVTDQTRWLLQLVEQTDIPWFRGAGRAGDWDTPAARFIAETCAKLPGEVAVIAVGPLGNLAGASRRDPRFFETVAGIYAMGGVTQPLRFPRRTVAELNLSCDPQASHAVLTAPAPIHLMSAQLCLGLPFRRSDLASLRGFPRWFRELVGEWYLRFSAAVGTDGFYLWDLVPIFALLHGDTRGCPGERLVRLESTVEDLRDGLLRARVDDGIASRDRGVVDLPIALPDAGRAGSGTIIAELKRGWARSIEERHI